MNTRLIVVWHYAPFGPIKFPVWLWRYVTLRRKLRQVATVIQALDDRDVELIAGAHIARLYCQLFPVHVVFEAAKRQVTIDGDRVEGRAVDVAFYSYLYHHPERRR